MAVLPISLDAAYTGMIREEYWQPHEDSSGLPIFRDDQIRRVIKDIPAGDNEREIADKIARFLRRVTSIKNAPGGDGATEFLYVDDPMVNGEIRKGRWRNSGVTVVYEGGGRDRTAHIIQTLRLGLATTLETDEARLANTKHAHPTGEEAEASVDGEFSVAAAKTENWITIYYPNIHPDYVHALAIAAPATIDVTEIRTRDATQAGGDWTLVTASGDIPRDGDGSGMVICTYARGEVVTKEFGAWLTGRQHEVIKIWQIPKTRIQRLINKYKSLGYVTSSDYNSTTNLFNLIIRKPREEALAVGWFTTFLSCTRKREMQMFLGVKDLTDSAYTLEGLGYESSSNITYDRRVYNRDDGLYDIFIERQTDLEVEIPAHTSIYSRFFEETTQGLMATVNVEDLPLPGTAPIGKQYVRTLQKRPTCGWDIKLEERWNKPRSTNEYVSFENFSEIGYRRSYNDQPQSTVPNGGWTPALAQVDVVEGSLSTEGAASWTKVGRKPKKVSSDQWASAAVNAYDEVSRHDFNYGPQEVEISRSEGIDRFVEGRVDPATGRISPVIVQRTYRARDIDTFTSKDSWSEHHERTIQYDIPTASFNTQQAYDDNNGVVVVEAREGGGGRVNVTVERRTLKKNASGTYDVYDDLTRHEKQEFQSGLLSSEVVLSSPAGDALSARVRFDPEYGKVTVEKSTITPKARELTQYYGEYTWAGYSQVKQWQDQPRGDIPDAAYNEAEGTWQSVRVQEGRHGRVDIVRVTEKTVKKATAEYDISDDADAKGTEWIGIGYSGAEIVLDAEYGEQLSASVQFDQRTGKFQLRQRKLADKAWSKTGLVVKDGYLQDVTQDIYVDSDPKNGKTTRLPVNQAVQRSFRRTSSGWWRSDIQTIKATSRSLTTLSVNHASERIEVSKYQNWEDDDILDDATSAAGTVTIISPAQYNDLGSFDTTKEVRTSKQLEATHTYTDPQGVRWKLVARSLWPTLDIPSTKVVVGSVAADSTYPERYNYSYRQVLSMPAEEEPDEEDKAPLSYGYYTQHEYVTRRVYLSSTQDYEDQVRRIIYKIEYAAHFNATNAGNFLQARRCVEGSYIQPVGDWVVAFAVVLLSWSPWVRDIGDLNNQSWSSDS